MTSSLIPAATLFLDLPPEMQVSIFRFVDPESRQTLRSVCQAWNVLIGHIFKVELSMNSGNWLSLLRTSAKILSLDLYEAYEYRLSQAGSLRSFCSRVRELTLSGTTLSSNCFSVLKHCSALRKLRLEHVQLSSTKYPVPRKKESLRKWLPVLEELYFHACGKSETQGDIFLLSFLASVLETGRLKVFKVYTNSRDTGTFNFLNNSFVSGDEAEAIQPSNFPFHVIINKLVSSNKSTLRTVSVMGLHGTLHLEFYPARGPVSQLYIRRYISASYMTHFVNHEPSIWLQTLARAQYLRELVLFPLDGPEAYQQLSALAKAVVLRNFATLKAIFLDFNIPEKGQSLVWNGDQFSGCVCLKYLTLLHSPLVSYRFHSAGNTFPSLLNTDKLPETITEFETNLSLVFGVDRFSELQLSNFKSIETLCLYGSPWFILNGKQHLRTLTLREVNQLKAKLPKWTSMSFRKKEEEYLTEAGTWIPFNTLSRGLVRTASPDTNKFNSTPDETFLKIFNPGPRCGSDT